MMIIMHLYEQNSDIVFRNQLDWNHNYMYVHDNVLRMSLSTCDFGHKYRAIMFKYIASKDTDDNKA